MPGVGVTPGFAILFALAALGMPGVGVAPFGKGVIALIGAMPGVALAIGEFVSVEFTLALTGASITAGTFALLAMLTEFAFVR